MSQYRSFVFRGLDPSRPGKTSGDADFDGLLSGDLLGLLSGDVDLLGLLSGDFAGLLAGDEVLLFEVFDELVPDADFFDDILFFFFAL